MRLEGPERLVHQRRTVGEEQHALGPSGAHQHVDQRDHRAGLARAGRHHQQRLALRLNLESAGDVADRALLVGTLDDLSVDCHLAEALAALAALDQQFQLVALVEAGDAARRVADVVPKPVLVAVGIEDDGAAAVARLEAVGVELGLLATAFGLLARALGLHQPEGLAVCAPQHVVDVADALLVRHTLDAELGVVPAIERPTGLAQQQVDVAVAGFGLVVVMRVGRSLGNLASSSDFGAQPLHLVVETGGAGEKRRQLAVPGVEFGLLRLELDEGSLQHVVVTRQRGGVEGQAVGGFLVPRVGARQPEADVEQFLDRALRVAVGDALLLMHGAVAQRVDVARLGEHSLAGNAAEARLVQQRGDVVVVGQVQALVGAKRPFDRDLDRLSSEERRRRRVRRRIPLRRHRRLVDGREFSGEEGEVGHAIRPVRAGSRKSGPGGRRRARLGCRSEQSLMRVLVLLQQSFRRTLAVAEQVELPPAVPAICRA